MRKTLINLTRFGDLLQTQPIIHALRGQGHEVSLICLENFAGAAALLDGVRRVSALPGSCLLSGLETDWRLCLQGLENWLADERAKNSPEAVLNLTPALSSRLLSRLMLGRGQPEGFSLDEYGFGRNSTPWAAYVQAVTLRRGCSPFNLVDGFRQMAGVSEVPPVYELAAPDEDALRKAEVFLAAKLAAAGLPSPSAALSPFVAFQLGASNDARRWPTGHFAELGRILSHEAGLVPLVLGSAGEENLAARYFAAGGPGVSLAGETDLPGLAAVLKTCRLLVSNDTGTMHLATGLGVPVLGIFLATAQPWDTGPYRTGMCCLEPRLSCHPCGFSTACPHGGACRRAIRGEDLSALILPWLESGQWPDMSPAAGTARIWLTLRDKRSFLDLRSLSGDEGTDRTAWIRLQRGFYRRFLDGLGGAAPEEETEYPEIPALSPEMRDRVRAFLDRAGSLLLLASEQGRLLTLRPSDNARKGLLATCERISRYFDASPDFVPLAYLWRVMVQDFTENGERLLSFFHTLRQHLDFLSRKIK